MVRASGLHPDHALLPVNFLFACDEFRLSNLKSEIQLPGIPETGKIIRYTSIMSDTEGGTNLGGTKKCDRELCFGIPFH